MSRDPIEDELDLLKAEVMASPESRREYENLLRLLDPASQSVPIDPAQEAIERQVADLLASTSGRQALMALLWRAIVAEQVKAIRNGYVPSFRSRPFYPPGG